MLTMWDDLVFLKDSFKDHVKTVVLKNDFSFHAGVQRAEELLFS